jgi:hypothetical protein
MAALVRVRGKPCQHHRRARVAHGDGAATVARQLAGLPVKRRDVTVLGGWRGGQSLQGSDGAVELAINIRYDVDGESLGNLLMASST